MEMTLTEILGGLLATGVAGGVSYLIMVMNKLRTSITTLEKEIIQIKNDYQRADSKLKGHIYNCINYKQRHQINDE